MTPNRKLYQGREQTFIKHLFLGRYLKDAAYKTFQGRSPIFNFVDGFAGPWETSSDGGLEDTSFSQSIKVLQSVVSDLREKGISGLKTRFCFCEKDPAAFARLKDFADKQTDVQIYLFRGEFETNLDKISSKIPDGFTFTFIDPTGFKVGNAKIAEFLKSRRGEFLFNFMAEHINRYPDFDGVKNAFAALLADQGWRARYDALPTTLKNEERILAILKEAFIDQKAAKYVTDFGIKNPRKDRMQMRLVHGTNSEQAVELFRQTQRKVELREIEERQTIAAGNQISLFSADQLAEEYQRYQGFGSIGQKAKAADLINEWLAEHGPTKFGDLWVNVLVGAAVNTSIVKDVLNDMRNSGLIEFQIPPGKKKVQPDTHISLSSNAFAF